MIEGGREESVCAVTASYSFTSVSAVWMQGVSGVGVSYIGACVSASRVSPTVRDAHGGAERESE